MTFMTLRVITRVCKKSGLNVYFEETKRKFEFSHVRSCEIPNDVLKRHPHPQVKRIERI
jgi:hypothetical protein